MNPALNYDTLRYLYVDRRMSYGEIARRQGVDKSAVATKLKRGTIRRGGTWPLRAPIQKSSWDTVLACGVVEYIKELRGKGVPYTEFAKVAGVSAPIIWELVAPNPRRTRITRKKAKRLMKAVEVFEALEAVA